MLNFENKNKCTFSELGKKQLNSSIWLGATKARVAAKFTKFDDGTDVDYTRWAPDDRSSDGECFSVQSWWFLKQQSYLDFQYGLWRTGMQRWLENGGLLQISKIRLPAQALKSQQYYNCVLKYIGSLNNRTNFCAFLHACTINYLFISAMYAHSLPFHIFSLNVFHFQIHPMLWYINENIDCICKKNHCTLWISFSFVFVARNQT